jgi:malate dehydrogenase (oxaloacetate-decarboxylating)
VAIISDGTRVLGLGDSGPKAGLPVMEGKALLYKYLGGVEAVACGWDESTRGGGRKNE